MHNLGIDALFAGGGNAAINDEFRKHCRPECRSRQHRHPGAFADGFAVPGSEGLPLLNTSSATGEKPSTPWPVYAADALKLIQKKPSRRPGSTDSQGSGRLSAGRFPGPKSGITGPISFDPSGDRAGALHRAYVVDDLGSTSTLLSSRRREGGMNPPPCLVREWRLVGATP